MIQTSEGQPLVGSPSTNVLMIITMIKMKEIKQNKRPIKEDKINGVVENAVIPSKA